MKKWYNIELWWISTRDALRAFLHDIGVYYELSACDTGYHFEILATSADAEKINAFIYTLEGE